LGQNYFYGIEAVEVGVLDGSGLGLGKFIYTNKKRTNWLNGFTIGIVANYFCSCFFIVDRV
jgi:hypothetical protein